ncbi:hypothetical protein vBCbaSRXM_46 [Citromicrobium phage vB_CbaS-RXM]|nr:hypothetical protein vBCbaSRXM_46 [Citromicrobium phage vB_CbaS-RXM]
MEIVGTIALTLLAIALILLWIGAHFAAGMASGFTPRVSNKVHAAGAVGVGIAIGLIAGVF